MKLPEGFKVVSEPKAAPVLPQGFSVVTAPAPRTEPEDNSIMNDAQRQIFNKIWDAVTGDNRKTADTEKYHMVDAAPEFAGLSQGLAKGLRGLDEHTGPAFAMALTSDPEKRMKLIQKEFPDAKFRQDEKGNPFVDLPSGTYALSKPGVRTLDVVNAIQDVLELEALGGGAGGRLATKAATGALAGAGSEAVNQELVSLAGGGPVSGTEVGIAGALNAIPLPGGAKKAAAKAVAGAATETAKKSASDISADELRSIASNAARKGTPAAMSELARLAEADPAVLAAAERLGFDPEEMLPSHYTTNEVMRQLIGKLSSRQGSELAQGEIRLLKKMAERTQRFITDNGGTLDGSEISTAFKQDLDSQRDLLRSRESELYSKLDEAVSPTERITATNTIDYLDGLATKRGGGLEQLRGLEKKISDYFLGKEGTPTYFGLNEWREEAGDAFGKFKDSRSKEEREMAQFYHALRADVKDVAERQGVGEIFDQAKGAGARRFAITDTARALLGKDEAKALMPEVSAAMKKLSTGKVADFAGIMKLLPEEYRQKAAVTALGDMFSQGSKAADVLNLPGAVNWLRDVKGNKQAWGELTKHLPQAAVKELDDMYTMFSAVRRARQSLEGDTGNKLRDVEKLINNASGAPAFAEKHPVATKVAEKVARVAVTSVGHSHGGPVASVWLNSALTSAIENLNKNIVPVLDRMMATPEFSRMATALERDGKPSAEAKAAHDALAKTPQFRSWWKSLPPVLKTQISAKGLMQWGLNEMQKEQGRERIIISEGYNDKSPGKKAS
jgi:hypothetical protein